MEKEEGQRLPFEFSELLLSGGRFAALLLYDKQARMCLSRGEDGWVDKRMDRTDCQARNTVLADDDKLLADERKKTKKQRLFPLQPWQLLRSGGVLPEESLPEGEDR